MLQCGHNLAFFNLVEGSSRLPQKCSIENRFLIVQYY